MNSKILYFVYLLEINWINLVFVGLPLCSWSLGWKQEIIKPRQKISLGYKESIEAELSYFTERYGFVDDEYVQHSGSYEDPETGKRRYLNPAEQILQTFVSKYLHGNEAQETRITKKYFDDPDLKHRLCPTYLKNPIFQYNNIELIRDHEEHISLYELKFVQFQYFTRKTESVKVVKCPVVVDGFITWLYFLEIYHYWNFSIFRRGYFVFFNKVVPAGAIQSLQLLMYVATDSSKLTEMDTEGEEADLRIALRSESLRTINIILQVEKPEKSSNWRAPWTAKIMIEKMNNAEQDYKHFFGEEAEIMLISKTYGFLSVLSHRSRPWKVNKMLSILDHMRKGYEINRERMEAVKKIEARKLCLSYIYLNDYLTRHKIVPQKQLTEAGYVSKFVHLTQFEYDGNYQPRELLKCPVTCGERKKQRNLYLLPIHYENTAKLPQLFTFFEDPKDPKKVNVFALSPVPSNVDEVDFNIIDQNLIDLTEDPSTSDPHRPRTSSDLDILSTASSDSDTGSFPTVPQYSDTTSLPSGLVDSSITSPPLGPIHINANTAPLTSDPEDSDTATLITDPVFSRTDSLPTSSINSDIAPK